MSRSNKNNGRKKLFKNDNETRCSSSSSSSNSEDGDVIRKVSSALDSRSLPYSTRAFNNGASLKGGSEAPIDTVYEYLTRDQRVREPTADKIRTNLKIVRIRKFQSNESKVLLIVDVPPSARQPPQQLHQRHQHSPSPSAQLRATRESGGGSGCRSEDATALPVEIGSREIFELSDELARKFDVDKETKSFEWHSFSRADDVIKLLLTDGGIKPVIVGGHDELINSNSSEVGDKSIKVVAVELVDGNDVGCDGGSSSGLSKPAKPATKKKRISVTDDQELAVATGFDREVDDDHNQRTDAAKNHRRSRVVRDLLNKYSVLNATIRNNNAPQQPATTIAVTRNPSTKTTTMPTLNKYRDTMVDETWKLLENCTTLRRENANNLHVLLGEDNVKGVSNCGADTSTSDANDDALNSSSSDENDSKAKKKNRCALCRKRVGLTGFECRCGGLYCGIHRYSDKHNCTFDYRQLGAQEIRRNNPVVVGEKIQKI